MSINRTIAAVSDIAITAVGLVACNDSEDKMDNKMDGSMTPSSAMKSEEKMDSSMTPSSAMMEPSSAMMSEEKMTEESK